MRILLEYVVILRVFSLLYAASYAASYTVPFTVPLCRPSGRILDRARVDLGNLHAIILGTRYLSHVGR